MKKVVRLADNRGCDGQTVRELRQTLRGIERGDIVGVCIVSIRRDGTHRRYFESECNLRALGAVDSLKDWIRRSGFDGK